MVVCKECRHAVWPGEIQGHLQGRHHKIEQKKAEAIADNVSDWPGLKPFASELQVPARIDEPISQLPLHEDGMLCQREPDSCQYVCRDRRTMKRHWRKVHEWAIRSRRGRAGKVREQVAKARFQEAAKPVSCQRFFPSRHGSQYFRISRPEDARED